jgi:hypothetical protein
MILTSNLTFKKLGQAFAREADLTAAMLDRLLHHAITAQISGESDRLKDKCRLCVIKKSKDDEELNPGMGLIPSLGNGRVRLKRHSAREWLRSQTTLTERQPTH